MPSSLRYSRRARWASATAAPKDGNSNPTPSGSIEFSVCKWKKYFGIPPLRDLLGFGLKCER
jgi:hypothetical protein